MSYAVMRPKRVTNVDTTKKAWTSDDIPYGIYCAFLFVALVALYVPFFNIQSYADQTLKMDEGSTSHILAVLNVADKVGALESSLFCAAVASVLCFCWLAINNVGGLVVFAIAYGCVSGTITGISPAVVANLSSDLTRVGRRIGICFGLASFGLLIGNPIATSLVGLQPTRFEKLQVFCGGTMLFSALILCLAIFVKRLSSGHHSA
jgi:MFS family permease